MFSIRVERTSSPAAHDECRRGWRWTFAGCALALLSACATTSAPPPTQPATPGGGAEPAVRPGIPAHVEPPAPAVNLSGFPLPYRQGYADGCASVRSGMQQDRARYAADGNYRTGWQDGFALCKKK
jgi:hypothetical protein